jgi:hypothetical protein
MRHGYLKIHDVSSDVFVTLKSSSYREVKKMRNLFLGDLSGYEYGQVVEEVSKVFQVERSELDGMEFLIAYIQEDNWDGSAYFLVRNRETGLLYEVIGGHCSCYGFEGQWEPKITSREYLLSEHWSRRHNQEMKQFVTELFN